MPLVTFPQQILRFLKSASCPSEFFSVSTSLAFFCAICLLCGALLSSHGFSLCSELSTILRNYNDKKFLFF